MAKIWNTAKQIAYVLLVIILCIFALIVVASNTDTPLKIRLYSVQSGSMEPAIKTGSVVISQQSPEYKKGDILTFKPQTSKTTVTHRIIKIEKAKAGNTFLTKGDANNIDDKTFITQSQVLGKVVLAVPFIGYIVEFSRTQIGFVSMVIIPATLIVYSELMNIKNEIVKMLLARKNNKTQ